MPATYQACMAHNDGGTYTQGIQQLGAKLVRYETKHTDSLNTAVMDEYVANGVEVILLAGIDNWSGSAAKIGEWVKAYGPGGTRIPAGHPGFRYVECGNEDLMTYSPKPGPSWAGTYGTVINAFYQAIQANNTQVKLLAQADVGNNDPTAAINAIFASNPSAGSQVYAWVQHIYGPVPPYTSVQSAPFDWERKIDQARTTLLGKLGREPLWAFTEDGLSTDNGIQLTDNYKLPVNMTYAQGADYWQKKEAYLKAKTGVGQNIAIHAFFQVFDQRQPGEDQANGIFPEGREHYFGAVKNVFAGANPGGDKGALSQQVRAWLAANPPTWVGSGGGGTTKAVTISPATLAVQAGGPETGAITATGTGFTPTAFQWFVNGSQKGNATVGTLRVPTATGPVFYTPPAVVPGVNVQITAYDISDPLTQGSATVSISAPPPPVTLTQSFEDTFTGSAGAALSGKWQYLSRFNAAPAAALDGAGNALVQSKSTTTGQYASGIIQYADALDCSGTTQRFRITWQLNAGGPGTQVARINLGKGRGLLTPKDSDTDLIWVDTDGATLTINQRIAGVDQPVLSSTAAPAAGTPFDLWFEIGPVNWRVRQGASTWLIGGAAATVPHKMTYADRITLAVESSTNDTATTSGLSADLVRFGQATPSAPANPTALESGANVNYAATANPAGEYVTAYTFALTGLGTQYAGASPTGSAVKPSSGTYAGTVTATNDWTTGPSAAFTLVVGGGAGTPPVQAITGASDVWPITDYLGTVAVLGSDLQEVLTQALGLLTTGATYEAANLVVAQATPPPSDDDRASSRLQLANQALTEVGRALSAIASKT